MEKIFETWAPNVYCDKLYIKYYTFYQKCENHFVITETTKYSSNFIYH